MAKTLVTGASGFIGAHVARALAERGDELRLLARRSSSLEHLDGLEFERTTGDITDRRAVRRAMEGVERVFHVAGSTSMRGDRERVFDVNVTGTRIVVEEALRAGVERVVHTSSAGAVGPARPGGAADESQPFSAGRLGIAYVNSKHEAEVEALRLGRPRPAGRVRQPDLRPRPRRPERHLERPGQAGDAAPDPLLRRRRAQHRRRSRRRQGHLLADAKGKPGERYILGGRNFTLGRLFADIGRISGVPPPPVKVPPRMTKVAVALAERAGFPVPVSEDEVRSAQHWWTYRNTKAKKELGFKPRPHEETLEDTVRWQAERLGDRVGRAPRTDLALRAFGRILQLGERVGLG